VTIWIDAQLSPALARWFDEVLCVRAIAVRDLGLRDATDQAIFRVARGANAVVLTRNLPATASQSAPNSSLTVC